MIGYVCRYRVSVFYLAEWVISNLNVIVIYLEVKLEKILYNYPKPKLTRPQIKRKKKKSAYQIKTCNEWHHPHSEYWEFINWTKTQINTNGIRNTLFSSRQMAIRLRQSEVKVSLFRFSDRRLALVRGGIRNSASRALH